MQNSWNPYLYQEKHSFVWQLSQGLVDVLAPQPGEKILDLGCGTGELTQAIAARGAQVIGIDADPAMIAAARERFPQLAFQVADARQFTLPDPVDALFSNAALHWIAEPVAVIERMAAALKPGGRLVVEFGGRGNMKTVLAAIATARTQLGLGPSNAIPWYFPAVGEYASLLEQHGFEVQLARLYDRPTQLEGEDGLLKWLQMFATRFWADLPSHQIPTLLTQVQDIARPTLYRQGRWWADYRRIQVVAWRLPSPPFLA